MEKSVRELWKLIQRILVIAVEGMDEERLPPERLTAEALGVSNALRANVLRMMFNGGLLEGRLIEGKELLAINVSPTLDGLQCLEWIRELLRDG